MSETSVFGDGLRSDSLPALIGLLQSVRALSPLLIDFVRFHLVFDANKVQSELRWRLGKRQNPLARTSLYESIVAGVVVAYAPSSIEDEIFEHETRIAHDTGATVGDVRREWSLLKPHLHFYQPNNRPAVVTCITDTDDLPYIATREQLGIRAIYTDDHHLKEMGAPVVSGRIDAHLRDYARASTIKLGISFGSGAAFALSIEALPVLYRMFKAGLTWLGRQSAAVQWTIVGTAFLIAVHPKSRAKFSSVWQSVAPVAGDMLISTADALLTEFAKASSTVDASLEKINRALPPMPRQTVLMRARVACVIAQRPLTLEEIERSMRLSGYESTSKHSRAYLRRVLVLADEFIEQDSGRWALDTSKSQPCQRQ